MGHERRQAEKEEEGRRGRSRVRAAQLSRDPGQDGRGGEESDPEEEERGDAAEERESQGEQQRPAGVVVARKYRHRLGSNEPFRRYRPPELPGSNGGGLGGLGQGRPHLLEAAPARGPVSTDGRIGDGEATGQVMTDREIRVFPVAAREPTPPALLRLFEAGDRETIMQGLRGMGIGCNNYFPPIHLQPYVAEKFGHAPGDFPVTEYVAARTIALPFFGKLTGRQINQVCDTLEGILERRLMGGKGRF